MTNLLTDLLTVALARPVAIQRLRPLGGGCINHASEVVTNAGRFFAKWNPTAPADLFIREAESLAALRKSCTILQLPEVVYVSDDPPILITTYLEPSKATAHYDELLGRGIAELHRCTHHQYGFDHDNYCGATLQNNRWNDDWVDFFGRQRIEHLVQRIEMKRGWTGQERSRFDQLQKRIPDWVGHRPAPALNHGDLWWGNYVSAANGPALIDPACYYADREFDLALMAMFGGYSERTWAAYREAYPLNPDWKERQDLYTLYHFLNHYYLFGGDYKQRALAIVRQYC